MFIVSMPKMCAIPQLFSAPLNPMQLQNILRGATHNGAQSRTTHLS